MSQTIELTPAPSIHAGEALLEPFPGAGAAWRYWTGNITTLIVLFCVLFGFIVYDLMPEPVQSLLEFDQWLALVYLSASIYFVFREFAPGWLSEPVRVTYDEKGLCLVTRGLLTSYKRAIPWNQIRGLVIRGNSYSGVLRIRILRCRFAAIETWGRLNSLGLNRIERELPEQVVFPTATKHWLTPRSIFAIMLLFVCLFAAIDRFALNLQAAGILRFLASCLFGFLVAKVTALWLAIRTDPRNPRQLPKAFTAFPPGTFVAATLIAAIVIHGLFRVYAPYWVMMLTVIVLTGLAGNRYLAHTQQRSIWDFFSGTPWFTRQSPQTIRAMDYALASALVLACVAAFLA